LAGLMLARVSSFEGTLVDVGLAELRSQIFWIGWTSWRESLRGLFLISLAELRHLFFAADLKE
jgi:hypothetical protein